MSEILDDVSETLGVSVRVTDKGQVLQVTDIRVTSSVVHEKFLPLRLYRNSSSFIGFKGERGV